MSNNINFSEFKTILNYATKLYFLHYSFTRKIEIKSKNFNRLSLLHENMKWNFIYNSKPQITQNVPAVL